MKPIITSSLIVDSLSINDAPFILDLLNTQGWKQFIGERNVHDLQDAARYIHKIINDPAVNYRVVRLKGSKIPVGVLTIIKRDDLAHHDIGFAFLPGYAGKGYAYESASALLEAPEVLAAHPRLLAISLKDNVRSIRLLEKLGMIFEEEINRDSEELLRYGIALKRSAL
ncbi:GNAT family N-acetyltransferase [Pedobacter polysacchareus]|uniref:GNAT family N-acetyltransferase n=1 Tax=Pedobacter polysacchareus TaxID=2861973 RepID=UPI001C99E197|nr:GNAT family N-acetyltransferase [Pedobacter polysacchareus]